MQNIDVLGIVKELKKSQFFVNCAIPMGYVDGLPVLKMKNSKPCLMIPFLKYKMTGVVDKTLVFPIKYIITIDLASQKVVGFEDLSYNSEFEKVEFNKPVGYFRHESIKKYNRKEYKEKRMQLYNLYSSLATAVVSNVSCSDEVKKEFSNLLGIMLEPSLKPIYKWMDKDFYAEYLG